MFPLLSKAAAGSQSSALRLVMRTSPPHLSPSSVLRKMLLAVPRKPCQTTANPPLPFDANLGLMSGRGSEVSLSSEPHSCAAGSKRRAYRSQFPSNCCDQTAHTRFDASTPTCGNQLSPLVPGTHRRLLHLPSLR